MNIVRRAYCRIVQRSLHAFSFFVRFPSPRKLMTPEGVALELRDKGVKRPIFISGNTTFMHAVSQKIVAFCQGFDIEPVVYLRSFVNPSVESIAEIKRVYELSHCDAIVSIGGGSSIDSAKALAVAIAYPNKPLEKLGGVMKVHRKLPFHIAVPTTAGSGSEASLSAVLTLEATHYKFAISSPRLTPDCYMLDGEYLSSSPSKLIAESGMDAYCHALEAYLGHSCTKKSKLNALLALRLLEDNLFSFIKKERTQEKADCLFEASHLAGEAFSRSYVGYVHALAHAVGGETGLPHGRLIAILLPHVLDAYEEKADKKLAYLADLFELCPKSHTLAMKSFAFKDHIRKWLAEFGIPSKIEADLSEEDLLRLAENADREANPLYPVPKLLNAKELFAILKEVTGV